MNAHAPGVPAAVDAKLIDSYAVLGATVDARRQRRGVARRFAAHYDGIDGWQRLAVANRLAAPVVLRSYAAWALVVLGWAVDPDYVVLQRPDLVVSGHDPQLEKAIELAKEALKDYQGIPPRPKYPEVKQ